MTAQPHRKTDIPDNVPLADSAKARLRTLLTGGGRVSAGSIQLIGLDELRSELGGRWDAVKDRVYDLTERLLDRTLAKSDVWLRVDADNYVAVFAQLDRQAAELVCGRIVAELHRLMLGHADTSRITVRTIVAEVDGSLAIQSAGLDRLLGGLLTRTNPEALEAPSAADGAAGALARQRETFRPGICFRPVYDVQHKVLSTYICRSDHTTQVLLDAARTDDSRYEEMLFQTDMAVLRHSVATYQELYANSFRYLQNLTVNFATLSVGRFRRDYLDLCRAIPPHLVPFVVFVLEELPPGVPYGRLAELIGVLKPYSRAVLVTADETGPDSSMANLATFAPAGIRGVGAKVHPGEPAARAVRRIQALGAHVLRHNLIFFVAGISNPDLLSAAQAAGASYVAGPLIGRDSEVPEHMKRVTERELIQRAGKGQGWR